MKSLENYIISVGNVKEVEFKNEFSKFVNFKMLPNFEVIKEKLGVMYIGALSKVINKLTPEQKEEFVTKRQITVSVKIKGKEEQVTLDTDLILEQPKFIYKPDTANKDWVYQGDSSLAYELNVSVTEELK